MSNSTLEINLSKGRVAIIDECDSDLAQFKWHVSIDGKSGYAKRWIRVDGKRKELRLHRIILERIIGRELLKDEFPDHINGNGLDNRRQNIRLATRSQNNANVGLRKDNTSGYKGVTWYRWRNKWMAQISVKGKHINLGLHDTAEEAYRAYCEASREYFGEFSRVD